MSRVGAAVCLSLGVPSSSPSNSPGPLSEAWPAQAPPHPPPESARILCAHMNEVRAWRPSLECWGEEAGSKRGLRGARRAGVSHCLYLEVQGPGAEEGGT